MRLLPALSALALASSLSAAPALASNATQWLGLTSEMKLQLIEGMAIGLRSAESDAAAQGEGGLAARLQGEYDYLAANTEQVSASLDHYYGDPTHNDVEPWLALDVVYDGLTGPHANVYRIEVVAPPPRYPVHHWHWHWR